MVYCQQHRVRAQESTFRSELLALDVCHESYKWVLVFCTMCQGAPCGTKIRFIIQHLIVVISFNWNLLRYNYFHDRFGHQTVGLKNTAYCRHYDYHLRAFPVIIRSCRGERHIYAWGPWTTSNFVWFQLGILLQYSRRIFIVELI